jgi:hypothetical protein
VAKVTHHVVPSLNGGWVVKKGGSLRATRHFETKSEALSWARKLSIQKGSLLVIHERDGTIESTDAHRADPPPPRDRR